MLTGVLGASAELDPAKVERLAVRLRAGRSPKRAARLAGLADDPQVEALLAAAQGPEWAEARAGSRQYAAGVISEARLLGLLRLREEMGSAPIGVVSQILSAIEKTAEAIGEEQPRTQLVYVRQFVPFEPPRESDEPESISAAAGA